MIRRCYRIFIPLSFLWIMLHSVAIAEPPQVDVRNHNGRPTIFADGKPLSMSGYNTFGERGFTVDQPDFYAHDTQVFFISAPTEQLWPRKDRDISDSSKGYFTLDQQADLILKARPDAWIMVRFGYWDAPYDRSSNSFMTEEGDFPAFPTASLAADEYWKNVFTYTETIVRYCESRPWADRLLGYADFLVTEGNHMPVAEKWLFDHSPNMLVKWRSFLKQKYGSVEALRAAHSDSTITFDTVMVPFDKLRGPVLYVSASLYWQNRKDTVVLRDYLELISALTFGHFRTINQKINGALDRDALVLFDSFKQIMQGWEHWGFFAYNDIGKSFSWGLAFPEFQAGSGVYGISGLLEEKGFDGLITPHDYYARGIGGIYEPEGIADSMVLRGKFFYTEMDTRSPITNNPGGGDLQWADDIGQSRNIREWEAVIWRNLATGFTRGFHSYWMEFGSGWFHDPAIQKVTKRQIEVINESVNWVHEDVPGIVMIVDDTAVLETNFNGSFQNEAVIWEWKMGLARCGVPHRIYLFDDLKLNNFPEHCVYYFPNLFRVDDKRLALLREKVFRNGNVIVWGPGSGIVMDGETGTKGSELLTGFSFSKLDNNAPRRVLVTNHGHSITTGLDEAMIYGSAVPYGPVLLPRDGEELGLVWTKGGFTYSGLAIKEFGRGAAKNPDGRKSRGTGDYASVFTCAVPLPADLWRNLARFAGAHVYTESNDVIMADRNMVAIHSVVSGKKTISLPEKHQVIDVITGKVVSRSADRITFKLSAPETRIFRLK